MLSIDWAKVDKFYLVLIATLVLLSLLVVFAFKSVFSAYNTAYEVTQGNLNTELKINKDKLDEVYNWVFTRPK